MEKLFYLLPAWAVIVSFFISSFLPDNKRIVDLGSQPKGCVFRTVFGEDNSDAGYLNKTPEKVVSSIDNGLKFLVRAQQKDGGWGAGSHSRQDIKDPHAVSTDPATTAMVAMAMLRSGNTLQKGMYTGQLTKATEYLLSAVENAPINTVNITEITSTQIQSKLGKNIDVILTAQYFSNLLDNVPMDQPLKTRVKRNLNNCVERIQKSQDQDGSFQGAGWAGVLQSSLATNALESAQKNGARVDNKVLEKSKNYQKGNYDATTGDVKTDRGAGIVLYSISGSVRSSAKDARQAEEEIKNAKKQGKLPASAPVSAQSLESIGYDKAEALKYATSYEVYNSAKDIAQDKKVMTGFGNNGGEEFLSYLQTGESLIINKDGDWEKWYDNVTGQLLSIQNNDGTWNGHHCITSPVFCTATCLLILSVTNDMEKLEALGRK